MLTVLFKLNSGTAEFLRTNPEFVEDQSQVKEIACNKDTGGLKAFHSWSRGVFFIVSAGGHIEYWQPLYRYSTGNFDMAMEMIDKIRCDNLYSHSCTEHCKSKGW